MLRTAYAIVLLLLALAAAYGFGAINAGLFGYGLGLRSQPPAASEFLLAAFHGIRGGALLLLLLCAGFAALAAMLMRRAGQFGVLDMLADGRVAAVQSLAERRSGAQASAFEVLLVTVAGFAATCCGLALWGSAERWSAETVGVLAALAVLETVCALALLVLVVVRRPRSLAVFIPAAVLVVAELALVVAVSLAGTV